MNQKIYTFVLLGTLVSLQCVNSQTNDMATNAPTMGEIATNAPVIEMASTNAIVMTNEPAMAVIESDTNAIATGNGTNVIAATIPLIQFQDVPITTAIESLARQAGINYLLDPKIGYGQTDKNGQVKAEPTLSIRWENISAEHALTALLENYDLQIIEDRRTGIARITTKDPAAPPALSTRVVQLKYTDTIKMVAAVESTFTDKRSKVLPDTRTSQLVVVATELEQEAVDTLILQLDKPTRQVLIETKLVEISSNPKTQKGIDWSGTLQAQHVTFGNNLSAAQTTFAPGAQFNQLLSSAFSGGVLSNTYAIKSGEQLGSLGVVANTASGFGSIGFLNADGVAAVISFLNSSSDAQVMSTPRVVTLDNETAMISVTRGFPVINVTASTAGVSSGSSQIAYTNVGTILHVTPRISANDYIYLKVNPEVSSFFGTVSKTIAGQVFQADEFDTRVIDTQVLIPNANTLVMGGLVKDSPQGSYTKVPILGDIPILGYAFRSENKSLDKDNLLIFITPTIVKDADFKPTTTEFLDSQPTAMKEPMNPHQWWDSSKPRGDWSNPAPMPNEFEKQHL